MNIYLLTQIDNTGYDTFDSCVVIAENEEEARNIHPAGLLFGENDRWYLTDWCGEKQSRVPKDWAKKPSSVIATLIGTSNRNDKRIVCASFNAG